MIHIQSFAFNAFQVNTYILSDETKNAVIIDPACSSDEEFELIKQYIDTNELKLNRIINTHAHVDHLVGVHRVSEYYKVPFSIHQEDLFLIDAAPISAAMFGFELGKVIQPDSFINEGETINFGNSSLKAIHVPGHSPGSIVYYSEVDEFAIVGDVLFAGSIGRTDLPKGDYDTLISGIKNKLLTLPKNTKVFSGHGGETTIKQEHDTNPFLN